MDILYLIVANHWDVPEGEQWIAILQFIRAFQWGDSELIHDNIFKDT